VWEGGAWCTRTERTLKLALQTLSSLTVGYAAVGYSEGEHIGRAVNGSP